MDAESFKSIVLPCVDRMYRAALCLTGNEADAADAVQEACLKLWERREKLDGVANMTAYAVGTVRNVCIDAINGKPKATTDIATAYSLAAETDTEREYEARESLDTIERIISHLPEGQRTVVTMRDIEGMTMDEIEMATGYSGGNIRVLLSRARTTIRKHFRL